jgi:hypothetical protein
MPKKTYRYNPESKEMELVYDSEGVPDAMHYVRGDIEPFVSPINGAVIGSRSEYRKHTKRYGVIPQAELCPKEMARKAEERRQMNAGVHPSQKAARLEAIKGAFERARNEARARSRYG